MNRVPLPDYRLAKKNGVLVLQRAYGWTTKSDGGIDWIDIPTVDIESLPLFGEVPKDKAEPKKYIWVIKNTVYIDEIYDFMDAQKSKNENKQDLFTILSDFLDHLVKNA